MANGIVLKWYGKTAGRQFRKALVQGLEAGGRSFVYHIRASVNHPFPPASKPGEAPHRRTGTLYRSIAYWVRKGALEIEVGAGKDAYYWEFLEDGTVKMEERPFVRPGIQRWLKAVNRTIKKTIKQNAGYLR